MTGRVDRPTYQLEVVAAQAGPLMTCSGLQIVAHHAYAEIDYPIDTLIVTGGVAALERAGSDAALVAWIRETATRVRRVASVCTDRLMRAAGRVPDCRRVTRIGQNPVYTNLLTMSSRGVPKAKERGGRSLISALIKKISLLRIPVKLS
jgi:putative intracellular protease/amidase